MSGYWDIDERLTLYSIFSEFDDQVASDILFNASLINDTRVDFVCTMEELIFFHGESSEIYCSSEIRFIESINVVYVFPEVKKRLQDKWVSCRVVAVQLEANTDEEISNCVLFEKIINKALDGFNVCMFLVNGKIYFGCNSFLKSSKRNWILSEPISTDEQMADFFSELEFLPQDITFTDYYTYLAYVLTPKLEIKYYEDLRMLQRGIQLSYLDELNAIARDCRTSFGIEKHRYISQFISSSEVPYEILLEDADYETDFVKSNRTNTLELLFEAEEMLIKAENAEKELETNANTETSADSIDHEEDHEAISLLDDPEEMIKLFKKRRGI